MTALEAVGLAKKPEVTRQGEWHIAAGVSLQSILEWQGCPEVLSWSLGGAVTWQMRVETSLERALKTLSVAPQFVAALLSMGARMAGQPGMPLADALQRPATVAGDWSVWVPAPDGARRFGWAAVSRTPADRPIVAAVACVDERQGVVTHAGLTLTGAWRHLVGTSHSAEALTGAALGADAIARVAAEVEREVHPSGNFLGSVEYRRAMAGVLARRALEQCWKGVTG